MRKAFTIIFAVAILGGMSLYVNKHKSNGNIQAMANSNTTGVNATPISSGSNTTSNSSSTYKDGTYSGNTAETPYGPVQIAATISGGRITDVKFLQMPYDEKRSQEITAMSEPQLKQSTLSKQNVTGLDMVSGATSTYYGYQESLQAALDKAKTS